MKTKLIYLLVLFSFSCTEQANTNVNLDTQQPSLEHNKQIDNAQKSKENEIVPADTAIAFVKALQSDNDSIIDYWIVNGGIKYATTFVQLEEMGDHFSPMGIALFNCDMPLIKKMEQAGAIIDRFCFGSARGECIVYAFNSLLKNNADTSNLLHWCLMDRISVGDLATIQSYIKLGADINRLDQFRTTMLHHTVSTVGGMYNEHLPERLEVARTFLEMGADVNAQNEFGSTVAHILMGRYNDDGPGYEPYQKQRIEFLKLFKEYNIDLTVQDNKGKTFWDYLYESPDELVKQYAEKSLKK